MEEALIRVKDLCKIYNPGENEVRALDHINLEINKGEFVAIIGQSGSGKSTSMNMLGCLDVPTSGEYFLNGTDVSTMEDNELSEVRNREIGFIFQEYNLLDNMTVQDNIALPLSLNGAPQREIIRKVQARAVDFGLESHLRKYPYQLSGGQKQRAASARALITKPRILFADEPTGALDSKSGKDLLGCLKNANEQENATILMVTHDGYTASYAKEVYFLKDGKIHSRLTQKDSRKAFFEEIMTMLAVMGGEGE